MNIQEKSVVVIHYTVKDVKGKELDSSYGDEPLAYIQGTETILPVLEEKLEGKKKGDKLDVKLKVEQAYGPRNEELIEVVGRDQFEEDMEIHEGLEFTYADEDDELRSVRVLKVDKDEITIDGNHPFAGLDLNFTVEVMDVREATAEELEHGHVHGPGGHHH